ncbi:MAG: dihydropteroate synthase [Bacteroidota bacterium]
MTIQLVDIFYPNVFKRYSTKYNIYRDLHEKDLRALEIREIDFKLAQRIKKIILSNKEICYTTGSRGDKFSDLLALGSFVVFKELAKAIIAIGNEDCGRNVIKTLQKINDYDNNSFSIGGITFPLDKAHVVGILNVTPDSFSDGGKFFEKDAAVSHGLKLLEDGAEILDIGGESSRPGSEPIAEEEELRRVVPVVEEILKQNPKAIISIDTTKAKVAEECLLLGAKIVNDISSFSIDSKMIDIVKRYNATVILMHMKGNPKTMQENPYYDDVVSEVFDYLIEKVEMAKKHGIKNIIVDPGIGFGKRLTDNYELLKRLNEFKAIGHPILTGLSNKSFLGKALEINVEERIVPTVITETVAIKNGARFIRTHNVKQAIFAAKLNSFIDNPEQLNNV